MAASSTFHSEHEGAGEAHDALGLVDLPLRSVAGRHDDEVGSDLHAEDLEGRQEPVVLVVCSEGQRGEHGPLGIYQPVAGEVDGPPPLGALA